MMKLAANGLPANLHNPHQGHSLRVLCVCMGGLLRSPTAAWILSNEPYNCNTRAAGIEPDWSLVTVDKRLLEWAEEIVCFEQSHMERLRKMGFTGRIYCLDIADVYDYRDPRLIDLIQMQLEYYKFPTQIKTKSEVNRSNAQSWQDHLPPGNQK